jgi:hypothetical protein
MDEACVRHALQLKVLLRDVHPAVWRPARVGDDLSIADLHRVIQLLMGWDDAHLHRFRIQGRDYGISHDSGPFFLDNPELVELSRFVFRPTERFLYEYDFTAGWRIDVRIEKVILWEAPACLPVCLGGREPSPPDGCGGPGAYAQRRRDAVSYEVTEDVEELLAVLRGIADGEASALNDPDQRRELECTVSRLQERLPFLSDRFERAPINAALRQAFAQAEGSP